MTLKPKGRREPALEAKAVNWARHVKKMVTAKLMKLAGVPDRVFFIPGGRPLIVEFKAKGEEPEEIQAWYLHKLAQDGYNVAYVDSWESFLTLMKKHGVI